ncbi:MAG TPA: hypothetical protein VN791_01165 [Acidimicrobiales bacterium]|nr:hypothetical protein [Acidimicrobiales bacterium]
MLAELLLHVGPEKTGTTTIQASLATSAEALTRAGTFVPLASGDSPGHHVPILREVVGDRRYEIRYAYSQDALSLADTLGELARNNCTRLLLSAEIFSTRGAHAEVLRLVERINPRKLTVIHAMRPVVPWLLSWHGQDIMGGIWDRGCWPVDRLAGWFVENVLTVDSACDLWRRGPWDFELRTLLLAPHPDLDICRMFADCAELPIALTEVPPVNARLTPCQLHLLQTLNVHAFDPEASLQQRAAWRGAALSTLRRHGVPPHVCDCAVEIDAATKARIEALYAGYVDRIVTASGYVAGDVADVTKAVSRDRAVHSRFPGPESAAACVAFLWHMVVDATAVRQELDGASTFWHSRADAYAGARDHWHEQAENWQKVAEDQP